MNGQGGPDFDRMADRAYPNPYERATDKAVFHHQTAHDEVNDESVTARCRFCSERLDTCYCPEVDDEC